ncbi:MAG: hypothetical protein SNG02_00230 [Rikenellaceae bacterium]
MYTIEVESSFEQMWRYNTIVMCGGYGPAPSSEQLYVVSKEDIISDIENLIECEPKGYELPRKVTLEAEAAAAIRVIIYVVPHTLPLGREVDNFPPFDLYVRITKKSKSIYAAIHEVNQWGGASIEINLAD